MPLSRFPLLFAVFLVALLPLHADDPAPASSPFALPESVQIRNVQFGLLLRPRDASNQDGIPLVLYPAQPWKCMTWTMHVSTDGLFSLKNRLTAKTFSPSPDGTVKQIPFDAAKLWRFEKLTDGHYRILDPAAPDKALTARTEDTLAFDDWKNAPAQQWEVFAAPAHLTM